MSLARSTVTQRADLIRLDELLDDALASLPSRFFATEAQHAAYAEVQAHLKLWLEWEDQ